MEQRKVVLLRLDMDILRMLDAIARLERRSRNATIRELVLSEADRRGIRGEEPSEVRREVAR